MREAVICAAVRSPVGKRDGELSEVHPVDLSADVLNALLSQVRLDASVVEDVMWGCVSQVGDQSSNIARYSVLAAGWPDAVPGTTINRACGSSQQALDFAAMAIMSGQCDLIIAGGVESMSRVPLGAARQVGQAYGPRVLERYSGSVFSQGIAAEMVAQRWDLSRLELDEFAVRSHELAKAAVDGGAFDEQIAPIQVGSRTIAGDECIRRDTSADALASLRPSFQADGVIHAGNSSQIADGAAALLVTSRDRARELGLTPLVRYRAGAASGADPALMLTAPIPATQQVLKKANVRIDEIGVFEVNEAFASVPLAWLAEIDVDPKLVNPLGGSIALGHPMGAGGAVLMTKMVHHMRQHGVRYGLQTMCEGGGTANATVVELIQDC